MSGSHTAKTTACFVVGVVFLMECSLMTSWACSLGSEWRIRGGVGVNGRRQSVHCTQCLSFKYKSIRTKMSANVAGLASFLFIIMSKCLRSWCRFLRVRRSKHVCFVSSFIKESYAIKFSPRRYDRCSVCARLFIECYIWLVKLRCTWSFDLNDRC